MRSPWPALVLLLLIVSLVYLPGLSGSLLFDDLANLQPIQDWLRRDIGWQLAVFGNGSGVLGRPLSMLTFLASASLTGFTPWSFKLGNLLIHLVNGLLVFALYRALAQRDRRLSRFGWQGAWILAAIWLLHPLLVSTVLYAVQRMAMLSALFVFLALLSYLHGRTALEAQRARAGMIWLFGAVPVFTLLAMLAKENGALAPLLCGVLELCYFAPSSGVRRPAAARAFVLLGVGAPILCAIGILVLAPDLVLAGYQNRSFTLTQRLLTEARVLFDYVGTLLLPWGPRLGLYFDDYPLSGALFSPPSTFVAILAWITLASVAFKARRRLPGFAAGLGIFLVGHALESSVFPLLIYFEHRNYLPAVGAIWAVASLAVYGGDRLAPLMHRPRAVFVSAVALLVLTFAVATHARAWVWQSHPLLLAQALKFHPNSRWLRMELANAAMNVQPPQPETADAHYRALLDTPNPSSRHIGQMGLVAVDCFADGSTSIEQTARMFTGPAQPIEADLLKAIESLGQIVMQRRCEGLSPARMAMLLRQFLDRSTLPESTFSKWRLRFFAARLFIVSGQPDAALQQAEIAWNSGAAEAPVGALLVGLHLQKNEYEKAAKLLLILESRVPESDLRGKRILHHYRERIEAARASPSSVK